MFETNKKKKNKLEHKALLLLAGREGRIGLGK